MASRPKKLSFYLSENSSSSAAYDAYIKFPEHIKHDGGYQLYRIQEGLDPVDAKPMSKIGVGVFELRLDDDQNEYRVIYVVKFEEAIWILHAFSKKTRKTRKSDIDIAKNAYRDLLRRKSKAKTKHKKITFKESKA